MILAPRTIAEITRATESALADEAVVLRLAAARARALSPLTLAHAQRHLGGEQNHSRGSEAVARLCDKGLLAGKASPWTSQDRALTYELTAAGRRAAGVAQPWEAA